MVSIARRPNGRWRPRYRDAAGKEHARHFEKKADTQAWLDSVTTSVLTGAYIDSKRTRVTLAEWAGQWLETKVDLKPTTWRCYEVSLRVHILPVWGPVRLGDITHQGVAAWVAQLSRSGKSASTVRHAHRVLSLILGLAVRDGRRARNPAVGVPLPRRVRGEQIFLTYAQVDDLAAAAGRDRLAILFLAYTGVRYGEMAALRCATSTCCAAAPSLPRRSPTSTAGRSSARRRPISAGRCPFRGSWPRSSPSTSRTSSPATSSSPRRRVACCTCATSAG